MKNLLKGITTKLAVLGLPLWAMAMDAQGPAPLVQTVIQEGQQSPIGTIAGVGRFFITITNWALAIAMLIGIVLLIMAGIQYMQAGGDTEAIKKAKGKLVYSIAGIAIALLARGLVALVVAILGGEGLMGGGGAGQ